MAQSKGWNWDHEKAERAVHLKPTEYGYYFAHVWRQAGRESVLDLGAGLGRHAICFAKGGLKVSAVDMSASGIKHLRAWADEENLEIDAQIGDMLSLPYGDQSFDCVFAYHVISHCDSIGIRKIIGEIERVLKPGGEVFLSFSSKETTDFIEAARPKADANTMLWYDGPDTGASPILYVDLADIMGLLANFKVNSVKHTEYCSLDTTHQRHNKYYYVSAVLE